MGSGAFGVEVKLLNVDGKSCNLIELLVYHIRYIHQLLHLSGTWSWHSRDPLSYSSQEGKRHARHASRRKRDKAPSPIRQFYAGGTPRTPRLRPIPDSDVVVVSRIRGVSSMFVARCSISKHRVAAWLHCPVFARFQSTGNVPAASQRSAIG